MSGWETRKAPALIGAAALLLLGALLAVSGLMSGGAEFGGPLSPRPFALGGERYQIDLPQKAAVSEDPSGAFVWIELDPGARSSPSIWMETPYDETQPFAFDLSKSWNEGPSLDYRTELSTDGSGGAEASLDGRLTLGAARWSIACVRQGEGLDAADADWCLPLLGSLAIASPS